MAELKTKENEASVEEYINGLGDEKVSADCHTLINIMQKATGAPAKMWGDAIVGFGAYTYKYASGVSGDWPIVSFSPRKTYLTLYVMPGAESMQPLLKKLGKHKTSKACLYIKHLSDVDLNVLQEIINFSIEETKRMYPAK